MWCILNNYFKLFHLLESHIYIFSFILYLHHLVPWPSTLLVSFHAVAEHLYMQWSRLCSRAHFVLGLDIHKHLTCCIVLSDLFCTVIAFGVFLNLLCVLAGAQNFVCVWTTSQFSADIYAPRIVPDFSDANETRLWLDLNVNSVTPVHSLM